MNSPDAAYYGLNGLFDNNSQWYTLVTVTTPPERTTRYTISFNRPMANTFTLTLPTDLYNKNGDRVPNQSVEFTYNEKTKSFTTKIVENKS